MRKKFESADIEKSLFHSVQYQGKTKSRYVTKLFQTVTQIVGLNI
jgi:hypothetical protein